MVKGPDRCKDVAGGRSMQRGCVAVLGQCRVQVVVVIMAFCVVRRHMKRMLLSTLGSLRFLSIKIRVCWGLNQGDVRGPYPLAGLVFYYRAWRAR